MNRKKNIKNLLTRLWRPEDVLKRLPGTQGVESSKAEVKRPPGRIAIEDEVELVISS